ncbi:MAG: hypothetical protein IPM77_04600 [Crocinitomicaceae bacterium]|nr:hypothetical protein [Crocinitomicaceae bacterium]
MRFSFLFSLFLIFLIVSCKDTTANESTVILSDTTKDTLPALDSSLVEQVYIIDTLEQSLIAAGLVNVQDSIPEIFIDLRYSDTNNFMHKDVYGHLNRAYIQPDLIPDLKNV